MTPEELRHILTKTIEAERSIAELQHAYWSAYAKHSNLLESAATDIRTVRYNVMRDKRNLETQEAATRG